MTAVKKFLFDRDFDAPTQPSVASESAEPMEATEPEVPTFSEEDVVAAEQKGYAEGREDGIREAAEATEREIADALASMPEKLAQLFQLQEAANRSVAEETLAVATAIARKAFPDLNARNALGEIERMVRDVLESVIDEPRVQIFVAPALRDPLSERLATIAERVGYDGRIAVAADKSLKRGDCRVEWNNGGATRNLEALWTQIDEIVERNLGEDVPRHAPEASADDESAAESASVDAPPPAQEPVEAQAEAAPADAADTAELPETADPGESPAPAESGDESASDAPASELATEADILADDEQSTESETPSDGEQR